MADTANPGLDLEYGEEQEAVRAAVARFCQQRDVAAVARATNAPLPRELWRELAGLGVFTPAAPACDDSGDGAVTLCAIAEILGEQVFPGPLAATWLAMQVLAGDDAAAVMAGEAIVSLARAGDSLLPFGTEADVFLVVDGEKVCRARPLATPVAVATLGGEVWGRAGIQVGDSLPNAERGLALARVTGAAYLAGGAWRLLRETSDYAATRKQFGTPLGNFQAVSHPLADCAIAVTAARYLARSAATHCASSPQSAATAQACAGAALAARRAALATAFTCHQAYGAIGVTLEGPAFHITRRIRQLCSQAPAGSGEQEPLLASAGLPVHL